jgi:hypothetical protein
MADEEWRKVAKMQDGLLTRRQALHSFTDDQIGYRLRAGGSWQLALRGVIATFTGKLTDRQRQRAALLRAGGAAAITGATALHLYSVRAAPRCHHVHVAVLTRHSDDGFVRFERVSRMSVRAVGRLRVVALQQAVVATCLRLPDLDDVRAIVAEVVGAGRVTIAELEAELRESAMRGSKHLRQALVEVGAGAASAPEARWLAGVLRSKVLPVPHVNCSLLLHGEFLARLDGYFEDAGYGEEIQSHEYHNKPTEQTKDMGRRKRIGVAGIALHELRPSQLPRVDVWLPELEAGYVAHRRNGPPPGVTVTCHSGCPRLRMAA